MAGNVGEWTRSLYEGYPYEKDDGREIEGVPSSVSGYTVLRGGAFRSTALNLRPAYRSGREPDLEGNGRGFRCARSYSGF